MSLSTSKCVVLKNGANDCIYNADGTVLPTEHVTRKLGIQMTPFLNFDIHITQVVKSASALSNTIFRTFLIKPPEIYMPLFKTLIIPKLLYCSAVWRPHLLKHINLIENVQARFLRRVRFRCCLDKKELSLDELPKIMTQQDTRMLYKLKEINILKDFLNISTNSRRSQNTITSKQVARNEVINNMYAWRIARWLHNNPHILNIFNTDAEGLPDLFLPPPLF